MASRFIRTSIGAAVLAATLAPATARAVASSELYRTEPLRYGRYEARIRYASGDGVISSFFLWKDGSEMSGAYWNELDFEKLGADCHVQTNALYGTPRRDTAKQHTMPSDLCEAYHDYRFEWTPTYISWSIDEQEVRRDEGEIAAAFADNAPDGMTIHFNVWPGDASFGGNFSAAVLPVREYISWVQYSSYQNGTFTLQWREEFEGASLPSGWATGNWASPLNLSNHAPENVTLTGGMAVLSLTADNATGFTGTPPADTTANGGTSVGGASTGSGGAQSNSGGAQSNSGGAQSNSGGAQSNSGGAQTSSGGAQQSAGGAAGRAGESGGSAGSPSSSGGQSSGGRSSGGQTSSSGGLSDGISGASGTNAGGTPGLGGNAAGGGASIAGEAGQQPTHPTSESGCGCRVARHSSSTPFTLSPLLLAVFWLRRRRFNRG